MYIPTYHQLLLFIFFFSIKKKFFNLVEKRLFSDKQRSYLSMYLHTCLSNTQDQILPATCQTKQLTYIKILNALTKHIGSYVTYQLPIRTYLPKCTFQGNFQFLLVGIPTFLQQVNIIYRQQGNNLPTYLHTYVYTYIPS